MIKTDERKLLVAINNLSASGFTPRDIAKELDIVPQRARFLFEKWAEKGLYDYGVSVELGWLTDHGKNQAEIFEQQLEQEKRATQEVRA